MRLDKVHIENFRCFEDFEITLGKEVTILIGKNGSGKSNLIRAIQKGVSFIFGNNGHEKSLNKINECKVEGFDLWDTRFDDAERGFCFPTKIDYSGSLNGEEITWTFLKKKDPDRFNPSLYRAALSSVLYGNHAKNNQLPLIAFFSEVYPFAQNKIRKKAKSIITNGKLPREFGYYEWSRNTNRAEIWQLIYVRNYHHPKDIENEIYKIERRINIWNKSGTEKQQQIQESKERLKRLSEQLISNNAQQFLDFINEKLITFTRADERYTFVNEEFAISDILVNRPDKKNAHIDFLFKNGQSMFFDILPQGYKRLLSIVLEIACRSWVLNGAEEPTGIVFIDEVELHLHPTLQQEVVNRFKRTFPKIQFIFSTHSPLVISNLQADGKQNKIIKLEHEGSKFSHSTVQNIYGINYTTSLTEVMESGYRSSTIDKLINAYLVMKGKGKDEKADAIYEKLRAYLDGQIPKSLQTEIQKQLEAYQ